MIAYLLLFFETLWVVKWLKNLSKCTDECYIKQCKCTDKCYVNQRECIDECTFAYCHNIHECDGKLLLFFEMLLVVSVKQ